MSTNSRLVHEDGAGSQRASRLDRAPGTLSHDLAASRREVAMLKRENAALRGRLADSAPGAKPPTPPDPLSPRELEVLRLLALGHTNTETAGQLYLSVRTVETHRAHIQDKLGLTTRAELVRYALNNHLVGAA